MNLADCYKILELPGTATHKEVKAAQRKLILQWHPDKAANDPALYATALEKSMLINAAADFLLAQQPFVASPPPPYQRQPETNTSNNSRTSEEYRRQAEEDRRQAEAEANRRQQQEAEERRQQEAAEEAKQRERKQAADDRRWQEEERQRRDALAEEWQAEWRAEAAQSKEERKNRTEASRKAQQEAEAAQKAEQLKQRELKNWEKAVRRLFWKTTFCAVALIMCTVIWSAVTHPAHQAPEVISQKVYDTPQATAPVEAAPVSPVQQTDDLKWIAVRNGWINGDNGRSMLGYSSSQVHQLLGMPTAKLNRSVTFQDELWFPGTATEPDYHKPSFVSVIYKNDEAVQIENDVTSSDAPKLSPDCSTLAAIIKIHPHLQTATISYSDLLHADMAASKLSSQDFVNASTSRDEAMHLQEQTEVSYYDDVDNGIAFSFKVYTGRFRSAEVTKDTQPDRIIVHTPGMPVLPASYGEIKQGVSYIKSMD